MQKLLVTIEGVRFEVELDRLNPDDNQLTVKVNGEVVRVLHPKLDKPVEDLEWLVIDDRPYELSFDRSRRVIKDGRGSYPVEMRELSVVVERPSRTNGTVRSPIPGQIAEVMVSSGQPVETGQPLLILEAMKMANEIRAPHGGIIRTLNVAPGDKVTRDQILVEIE